MDRLLELTRQAEGRHFWFRGFRTMVRPLVRRAAHGRPGLRILDCGCGTGFNLRWLSAHGWTTGVDLTASGLEVARQEGRPLVRATAMALPYADAAFDVVTSFDVLTAVPDDRVVLAEMARVLKPGGHLVLNTSALDLLFADHSALAEERRRHSPGPLRQRLRDAGFDVVQMRYGFASTFPIVLAVRLFQTWRREPVPTGDEMSVPPEPINALLSALVMAEAVVSRVVPMPIGSSLRVLARKPV